VKVAVVYASVYYGNTEKVAKVIAEVLKADLYKAWEVDPSTLLQYDLIGFGSGIYFGKHHKSLFKLVEKLLKVEGKKAFVFSTSGIRKIPIVHNFHKPLIKKLREKGFSIVGEFSCRGFEDYGPFKLIGGINKGRPSEEDLNKARKFAFSLKENLLQDT